MNILDVIKRDHKKIRSYLSKLNNTTEEQVSRRKALFKEFKKVLITHARSEEKAVYIPLKTKQKSRDLSFEGYVEHHVVDKLVKDLSVLSPSSEVWTAKMTVVKELLQHHLEEEEEDMFKKMRQNFDSEELGRMKVTMVEEERKRH